MSKYVPQGQVVDVYPLGDTGKFVVVKRDGSIDQIDDQELRDNYTFVNIAGSDNVGGTPQTQNPPPAGTPTPVSAAPPAPAAPAGTAPVAPGTVPEGFTTGTSPWSTAPVIPPPDETTAPGE